MSSVDDISWTKRLTGALGGIFFGWMLTLLLGAGQALIAALANDGDPGRFDGVILGAWFVGASTYGMVEGWRAGRPTAMFATRKKPETKSDILHPCGHLGNACRDGCADEQQVRPGSAERVDTLTKLAALRDAGVLTDEEFAAEKARVLKR